MRALLATSAFAACSVAAPDAHAAAGDWYARAELGVLTSSHYEFDNVGETNFDPGWRVSAAAGRYVTQSVRLEGEVQTAAAPGDNGAFDASYDSAHVSLYYDFDALHGVTPVAGLGVGVSMHQLGGQNEISPSLHASAGADIPLHGAVLELRYRIETSPSIDLGAFDASHMADSVSVGLRLPIG